MLRGSSAGAANADVGEPARSTAGLPPKPAQCPELRPRTKQQAAKFPAREVGRQAGVIFCLAIYGGDAQRASQDSRRPLTARPGAAHHNCGKRRSAPSSVAQHLVG